MAGRLELDVFKGPSTQTILGFYLLAPAERTVNKHPTSLHKKATLMFANIQGKKDGNKKAVSWFLVLQELLISTYILVQNWKHFHKHFISSSPFHFPVQASCPSLPQTVVLNWLSQQEIELFATPCRKARVAFSPNKSLLKAISQYIERKGAKYLTLRVSNEDRYTQLASLRSSPLLSRTKLKIKE